MPCAWLNEGNSSMESDYSIKIPEHLAHLGVVSMWSYSISSPQRLLNPFGMFLTLVTIVGYTLFLPIIYSSPSLWWLSLGAPFLIVAWFKGAFLTAQPRPRDRLILAIRPGFLGIGSSFDLGWLPRHNIMGLRPGVLGCDVLTLITGHIIIIPSCVARTLEFSEFIKFSQTNETDKNSTCE